jgi:magnesium-transporting ATPase (P-type)
MKAWLSRFAFAAVSVVLAALSLPLATFAATDPNNPAQAIFAGGFFLVFLVIGAAFYIFAAFALMTIAEKTQTPNAWLAWIPIANVVLMIMVARKPIWWLVLFLIPLVNIVVSVILWMAIAEARRKPSWWGILTIIPVLNLIAIAYLAWSD